jgi:predicted SnoaL-like aldol condensation-catalyzing enzyme
MFKKTITSAVAIGLLMSAGAVSALEASPTAAVAGHAREEANKKLAAEFFRKGITLEERMALLHPDYIQHNPVFSRFNEINGLQGPAGFAAMIKVVRAAAPPGPPPTPPAGNDPTYMMVAEGDIVTVIQKRQTADPQNPGKFYETFWFETWRVKDGKLYEHWDAATIPEKIPEHLKAPQPK